MALFAKLKERLLKSSSRLSKQVDAIVEEGASEAEAKAPAAEVGKCRGVFCCARSF